MEGINEDKYLTKEHANNLPTVRITNITFENLKSTKFGSIDFACKKEFVPEGTRSDILGIYGQNGSGKTTLIQALSIIKSLLSGDSVDSEYSKILRINESSAFISIEFDFQYPNQQIRKVFYSFNVLKEKNQEYQQTNIDSSEKSPEYFVRIDNEKVEASGPINNRDTKKQAFISYSTSDGFGPNNKLNQLFYSLKSDVLTKAMVEAKVAYKESRSTIFNKEMFDIFCQKEENNEYFQILFELYLYANYFLFVVDSLSNGFIRWNFALPLVTEHGFFCISTEHKTILKEDAYKVAESEIFSISSVLKSIIPGLELFVKDPVFTKDSNGEDAVSFDLFSRRGDIEMPIGYEADGVRKIIMYLKIIISAFNQKSVTVAIDELDAGVFEYLLGEILEIFQDHGKGQLIFTSHNLRPLEVLDKRFICFTTSNVDNRFIRMKSVGKTNNLRSLYLREIIMSNSQDEILYEKEKKFKILGALKNCKGVYNEPDM